jgi:dienelactone hydrolase
MRLLRLLLCALALALPAAAAMAQDLTMMPVTIEGRTVRLATKIYKPAGDGPFPTLIFHHGSTGNGRNTAIFDRFFDPTPLVQWFVQRGWVVALPSRRGRGGSDGYYDEGFHIPREQGYSCEPSLSVPGAERALRDIDAASEAILALPYVDRSRIVVGGQSRGGILSVAWAGRHPDKARAVINFVGGWMGTACSTASTINGQIFAKGTAYRGEMLWLYGEGDPYYPLSHSRANFAAFQSGGGKGSFHELQPPQGRDGHSVLFFPNLWADLVGAYLRNQGLPLQP